MLNYTYPKLTNRNARGYVAPDQLASNNLKANEAFDHGQEYRWQPIYGDEIWLKLQRAGLTPEKMKTLSVLEVCAGMGFLSYHILSKSHPKQLVLNDISSFELGVAKTMIGQKYPNAVAEWCVGDMHAVTFDRKFDLIIGNSFLHHFHNVPQVLRRFSSLLNPKGVFISLHEPTPMAVVVESAKWAAYPLAILAPIFVNNIARYRYTGGPSSTDLWIFEPKKLQKIALSEGFDSVTTYPWHLCRSMTVQSKRLHLSADKPSLSAQEESMLYQAMHRDASFNRFLPQRFFGSFCLVCRK